jgi:hypothetical protein
MAGGAHEDSPGRGLHAFAFAAQDTKCRGGGLLPEARQYAPYQVDNRGCWAHFAQ